MALLLITGVAGTGKTLYCMQKYIIPELIKGNRVYSNIDGLVLGRVSILYDVDIIQLERTYFKLKNPKRFWEEIEKNSMVVLDEAQNVFNNREWQSQDNNDCIKYLMEHRHYGHQLVFITPHIDALDAGIRRVCEFTYKHKSYSMLGNEKAVKCAVFSQANTNMEPLKLFTWHHDVRIYDCYKSYFEEGTKEVKVRVSIFRNLKLWVLVFITGVMLIFTVKSAPLLLKRFSKHENKKVMVSKDRVQVKKQIDLGDYIMIGDSTVKGQGKYRREIK